MSDQRRSDEKWRARLTGDGRIGRNLRAIAIDRPPYAEQYPDLRNILDWKGNTVTNNRIGPLPSLPPSLPDDGAVGPTGGAALDRARRNDF